MPKGTNQKYKLYRLAQIMLKETDEEHFITLSEIQKALSVYITVKMYPCSGGTDTVSPGL